MVIEINTEYIELQQFLKFAGACATGGAAKDEIKKGTVRVNNVVCVMRGKKLRDGDVVEYNSNKYVVKQCK